MVAWPVALWGRPGTPRQASVGTRLACSVVMGPRLFKYQSSPKRPVRRGKLAVTKGLTAGSGPPRPTPSMKKRRAWSEERGARSEERGAIGSVKRIYHAVGFGRVDDAGGAPGFAAVAVKENV